MLNRLILLFCLLFFVGWTKDFSQTKPYTQYINHWLVLKVKVLVCEMNKEKVSQEVWGNNKELYLMRKIGEDRNLLDMKFYCKNDPIEVSVGTPFRIYKIFKEDLFEDYEYYAEGRIVIKGMKNPVTFQYNLDTKVPVKLQFDWATFSTTNGNIQVGNEVNGQGFVDEINLN